MPNLAATLKSEIARLARKELKAEIETLRKASAHYRSEIAELKRRIASQEHTLKKLGRQAAASVAAQEPADEDKAAGLRFRAGGFASLRKRLDLSAEAMGRLIGVSGQTVYLWEQGKTKPRSTQLGHIAAIRKLGKREVRARLTAQE